MASPSPVPLVERARARGAQLVVIEPRRSRTAERADWHLRVNVGTDAALALGVMHILARDGLCDRDYIARESIGFDRLERDVLPRFDPARVTAIKDALASGSYQIDDQQVADRLLRFERDLVR